MATLLKRVQKLDLVNEYLIKTNSQKYFNGTRGLWISNNRPDPERPGIARGQQLPRSPGDRPERPGEAHQQRSRVAAAQIQSSRA